MNEPGWKHYNAINEILSRPIFGNTLQMPQNQKIVISPHSIVSNDCSMDFQIKTEDDDGNSMDYDEDQLRPEDLLSVVEEEEIDNVPIKSEPIDDDSSIVQVTSQEGEPSEVAPQIQAFQNSVKQAGNKISIVPTKLLLKSPTTILPKPTVTSQTQGSHVPMKLLFVNTNAQNNSQMKATNSVTLGNSSKFFHHDQKMNLIRTTLCTASKNPTKSETKIDPKVENDEEKEKPTKNVKFPSKNYLIKFSIFF